MNQITSSLAQNKLIDQNTANNVVRLADYYNSANKHKNSIEQMIKTKNFDVSAANDAYQFMMTGTNAGSTVNQANQNRAYSPSFATPGIIGSFSNSFSGESPAYKQSATSNNQRNSTETHNNLGTYTGTVENRKSGGLELSLTYDEAPTPTASTGNKQSLLTTGVDVVTDFTPGVSNVKDATIALTGVNPITGEKVGLGGRLLSGFFALPVVGNAGKYIVKGGALAYKGVKLATKGVEVTAGIAKAGGKQVDDVAGSIRNVNPTKGKQNCVNCSIATDSTLGGKPASALSGNPTSIRELELHFGGKFGKASSKLEIEATLLEIGHGARGIVFGSRGNQVGHVFNVVNQKGIIRFLDGQSGKTATLDGFTSLHLLKTAP